VVGLGGVADFDSDTLGKVLAGKQVSASAANQRGQPEAWNASASSKDLRDDVSSCSTCASPRRAKERGAVPRVAGEQTPSSSRTRSARRSFQYFKSSAEAALQEQHAPQPAEAG